jgi:hypothetical protein
MGVDIAKDTVRNIPMDTARYSARDIARDKDLTKDRWRYSYRCI